MIGHQAFFFLPLFISFHTRTSLLTFSISFCFLFHSYCTHVWFFLKHSYLSSPFPIAILNGTFFFHSVKAMDNWKPSAISKFYKTNFYLILCYDTGPFHTDSSGSCDVQASPMPTHQLDGQYLCLLSGWSRLRLWVQHTELHGLWTHQHESYPGQIQPIPADQAQSWTGLSGLNIEHF